MVSALPRPSEAISLRVCAASVFQADKTNDDTSIRTRQKATKPNTHVVFSALPRPSESISLRMCGASAFPAVERVGYLP